MNPFLEHLSTRVDATAVDLKTSLHSHVDSTVDNRLDTFKVELASLVRSAVVECIRTEGSYQHWRVETTYTPIGSAHSQHHSGDVRLMPNHSTSYIEGIPPPLLTSSAATPTSLCIADVTFPSGHSVSIPLYNVQPTHHQLFPSSMHSSLLSNDNLDTTEQDNTSAQSAQTNNNQQISHEPFQTDNRVSLLPIASTSAAVSDGLPSTNSVSLVSPSNVSTHTVQLSDHVKQEHLDEQSHNGHHQQMDSDDRGQSCPFKSQRMGPVCNCPHPPKRTVTDVLPEVKEEEEEDTSKMNSTKDTQLVVPKVKEEEDEDDEDDGLIRGGDHSQVDDERYEVTQPNVDCGQLLSNPSRDRKNASNANESIEEGGTNLSSEQLLNTANQSDDQTVTHSGGDLFSPSTSTGLGSNRTALDQQANASTGRNATKRKQPTSHQTAKRSKQTIEDDDDDEDITNEDREDVKVKVLHLNCTESNCNVKLDSLDHLHIHLSTVHRIAPLRCFATNCNARFDKPQQISAHNKLHHSSDTRFPCLLCNTEYDSQKKANNHWYHYHLTGQFQCNLVSDCVQVTNTRPKMTTHQQTKHHYQSKHLHCTHPGCAASFSSNFYLKRHELTHLDSQPFHCNFPQCSHRTNRRSSLITHIRTQHFGLPVSIKAQKEMNIVDLRDPNEYVRVVVDDVE